MVSIFVGSGSGFARGSGNIVGAAGLLGSGTQGRGGDNVSVNAATGNLLISRQDEFLVGRGPDASISRTYNSLAQMSDGDNGDQWQQSTMRRVFGLTGTLNTAGSTIGRQDGDGSVIVYSWDAGKSAYITTEGDGAHDKLVKSGATWIWTDGSSQWTETYEASVADAAVFRIKEQKDTDGNILRFAYLGSTDKLNRVTTANHDATGVAEQSYVEYSWSGNNITQIITGYTDYGVNNDPSVKTDDVNRTLTRTRYAYDASNRLISVTVDLSPDDSSVTDGKTYVTSYTYDGASDRVASITQTDGSSLVIAYDTSGRVATLTQAVAGSDVRVTRIGYGVNVSSVTGPDGQVTRMWYDNKGQLVQLMSPPATQGGLSQVLQFEYDASGNLVRTIETDSSNASTPNNLVQAASWGDGEGAGRGDNLVDDSGWPQDVDGTLPANGTIGQGWTGAYTGETEWTVTTGPYGKPIVSLHAGQDNTADAGGGAYSQSFPIDKSKAYEFTLYFKADALNMHQVYFGLGSGVVKNGTNGAYDGNPYFTSNLPGSGMEAGKWYKIVGYVLPGSTSLEAAGSYGGIYDIETGERIKTVKHFIWDETQTVTASAARFFNFYNTQNQGKFTHFFKPEVREVSDAAILRGSGALDISRDRNFLEVPYPSGWSNNSNIAGDGEARWEEVLGPDGAWQVGLETGQFDAAADGGGAYTNQITIDPTQAYRFTQYVRKSDLTRHNIYFGLTSNATPYVKNAASGAVDTNPYFVMWAPATQQANMDENGWYKIVGYVLPEGSANIAAGSLGGIYDAETGERLANAVNFRWNEGRANNQVYARFFTYYDQALSGWSADWLAPEVLQVDTADLAADSANPFGITYDEGGRITAYTHDSMGNILTSQDANNNIVTRTYGTKNELLTETRTGSDASGANVDHTTRYVYDAENHLRYRISPEGRVTEYRYFSPGALQSIFEYPEHDYPSGTAAPSDTAMNSWRDGLPDRSSVEISTYSYDGRDNLFYTTDYGAATAAGGTATTEGYHRTYFSHDQSGRLLTRYNLGENSESFIYDGMGRLVASTDIGGGTTTFVFNDAALTTTVTTSTGFTTVRSFNKAGDLVGATHSGSYDPTGSENYLYDGNGRLRVATDALGGNSYFLYDKVGRKVADINHYGHITEYRYDAAGRIAATINNYNIALSAEKIAQLGDPDNTLEIADIRPPAHANDIWAWSIYDDGGRLIESIDGVGGVTVYSYDASDRLIKTIRYYNQLSAAQLTAFKTAPPSALMLPSANSAKDVVMRSFYDGDGLLIGALDGEGYLTESIYDASARLIESIAYTGRTSSSDWAASSFEQLRESALEASSASRSIHYAYDGQGLLRYTVGGTGHVIEYSYKSDVAFGATGLVRATIRHAVAISTTDFTYDNVKALVIANANAATRSDWSVYDMAGRVAFAIASNGAVTAFSYDVAGNVVKTIEFAEQRATTSLPTLADMSSWAAARISVGGNRVTRNWYTAAGDLRYTVDAEGYVTRFNYDAAGRLIREVDWDDQVAAIDTTTMAQVETMANAAGDWADVRYTYDSAGRRGSVYDGEGNRTYEAWYVSGAPSYVTHGHGTSDASQTVYLNDATGRKIADYFAFEEAEQAVVQYAYDGTGNLTSVTDARGKVTSYTYDRRGLILTKADAAGVTTYEYNAFGEVVKIIDAKGGESYSYYDDLGRVTMVRDAMDFVTQTNYTAFGEVESLTRYYDPTGSAVSTTTPPTVSTHAKDATTRFEYDKRGLVTKTTDAEGFFETFGYDAFGNRTSVTAKSKDAIKVAGGTTSYAYDKRGLLLSESLPVASHNSDGSVQAATVTNTYSYDSRGNRIEAVEAAGLAEARITTYEYDKANRLKKTTGQAFFGMTPEEVLTYDARGNVTSRTDAAGARSVYYYDDLDRVVATIDALGTYTANIYDANGNISSTKIFATTVTVPADGGSEEETSPPSGDYRQTTFTYDDLNRLLTSTVSGVKSGAYNGSAWAPNLSGSLPAPITTTYAYDAFGNVVKAVDANGNATWNYYDKLGRKTHQVDALNFLTTWTYDAEGNVLTEKRYSIAGAAPTSTVTPPAAPGVDGAMRETLFTYDRNGNRLSEARAGIVVHDGNGGVLAPQTVTISWLYNGLGQVVQKNEATDDPTKARGALGDESIYYSYDAGGRLINEERAAFTSHQSTIVRPEVDYYYNGLGHLTRTVSVGAGDALDRNTSYAYNGGKLASTTDATGFVRYYKYDIAGRVTHDYYTRLKSDGTAAYAYEGTLSSYDALGRVVEQWQAISTNASSWTSASPVLSTRYNAFGEVQKTGLNASGVAESSKLWQTENKYDAAGRLWATNAGDGVWKLFGYDRNGNQTIAITNAGEDLSGLTFDAAFAKVGEADVNGTYTVYDKRNMATSVIEGGRELSANTTGTIVTNRSYNAFGEVASETAAHLSTVTTNLAVTTYSYNRMGRVTRVEGPAVQMTRENGSTLWIRAAQDHYYDKAGRLVATRDANGTYADNVGNGEGNPATKASDTGGLTRLTLLAGTGYGGSEAMVTQQIAADNGVKQTKYDIHGDARTLLDELNRQTTQTFDAMGRVTQFSHAGGLVDSYAYDGLGQRTRHWNNVPALSGDVETTDYDVQGRVTRTRTFGGDVTTTGYTWDATIAASGVGSVAGGWIELTQYHEGGVYTGKQSSEKSDLAGRVTWKSDLGAHVTTYAYDIAGRQIGSTMGGVTSTFAWFNTGQLASNANSTGTESYSYDAAGNRRTEYMVNTSAQVVKNASATYDNLGRLLQWQQADVTVGGVWTPAASTTHSYDANGNIRKTVATFTKLTATGSAGGGVTQTYWFRFDSMNRLVVDRGMLSGTAGAVGTTIVRNHVLPTSHDIYYNQAGERTEVRMTQNQPGTQHFDPWGEPYWNPGYFYETRELYAYDAAGRLDTVKLSAGMAVDDGDEETAGDGNPDGPVPSAPTPTVLRSDFAYDLMGRMTGQVDYDTNGTTIVFSRDVTYNSKGQITIDDSSTRRWKWDNTTELLRNRSVNAYGSGTSYALGNAISVTTQTWKDGVDAVSGANGAPDTLTTTTYAWYDGAVQDEVTFDGDTATGSNPLGTTTYNYDARGLLTSVAIADGRARTVTFTNDVNGLAVRRDEDDGPVTFGDPHEIWYRFGGRQMGYTGNNGDADMAYGASMADRKSRPVPVTTSFRSPSGASSPHADFTGSYDAYNSYGQGSSAGRYTARSGDTLASVAASLWGDANLWYKLAETNGLGANASLSEGQQLTLPAGVMKNTHNANTFKPYDPAAIIGDTMPTTPKPPKGQKCGAFGQILMAAIAIGVAIYLPQLIPQLAPAAFGGGVAGGALSGAIGAAAGSAVSQGVGVATGIQSGFSWKSVGLAAIAGGIGGGISGLSETANAAAAAGKELTGFGKFAQSLGGKSIGMAVGRGVFANVATQGIAVATGLQSKFDFAGVAAAGVIAGVGQFASNGLPGEAQYNANGTLGTPASSGNVILSSAAGAIGGAATRSAITGESFGDNLMRALPDVVANSLILAGRSVLAHKGGNDGGGSGGSAHIQRTSVGPVAYIDQPEDGGVLAMSGGYGDFDADHPIDVIAPRVTGMLSLVGGVMDALGMPNPFGAYALMDIGNRVSMRLSNPAPRQSFLNRIDPINRGLEAFGLRGTAAAYRGVKAGGPNLISHSIASLNAVDAAFDSALGKVLSDPRGAMSRSWNATSRSFDWWGKNGTSVPNMVWNAGEAAVRGTASDLTSGDPRRIESASAGISEFTIGALAPLARMGGVKNVGLAAESGAVKFINPAELRWTQTSAGGSGRAAIWRERLNPSSTYNAYPLEPIDVVRTADGLTTLDHTRAAIALEYGITNIPARVHLPGASLPTSMTGRFGSATTWGEAAAYRAANQRPPLPPTGTTTPPRLPRGN